MSMFCYQCEQTAGGTGCDKFGVCGKDPQTAALQDLLTHYTIGIGKYMDRAVKAGFRDESIDRFVIEALFTTITNVDFDADRIRGIIIEARDVVKKAKALDQQAAEKTGEAPTPACPCESEVSANDMDSLVVAGEKVGIQKMKDNWGDDLTGLHEMALYGLKGAAAYFDHAMVLGKEDPELIAEYYGVLAQLAAREQDAGALTSLCMQVGQVNLKTMALLDAANTETYGHPEPTEVRIEPVKGKAILVSGHDLHDLYLLLQQTEGKGINIYTHSEMLPCNAYPKLKAFPHLVGNYGGAWQNQQKEFEAFPGAVLMTTNCIIKPRETYKGRIFTTGLVAWPGVTHVADKDFTPVIEAALAAPGFTEDGPDKKITIGFARNAVLNVAGAVIDAVKSGAVRHFFLVGGCDGAKPGRNYYTDFAKAVPEDCVILTLACGKFRFNKEEFGDIGGIPRLLDIGQCNDAYSAIQIALALADAFECGVNDLPLSIVLSWFEQKAVAILLTLLSLNVQGIRIGPTLPAFITPPVLQVLVDNFGVKPVGDPAEDLQAILA